MQGEPDANYKKEFFQNDNNSAIQFSDNFPLKWIVVCDYSFQNLHGFPGNPMNDNMPIKQSKNG
jgi:YT521-B-like domain